ncbi:hypothetical protein ASD89_21020 [Caulobacter sp. Root656]|nr:hypothetical protein ASD89_21020 [Caulobacter sp. Root656]
MDCPVRGCNVCPATGGLRLASKPPLAAAAPCKTQRRDGLSMSVDMFFRRSWFPAVIERLAARLVVARNAPTRQDGDGASACSRERTWHCGKVGQDRGGGAFGPVKMS